jgi:hypothetical protein
VFIRWQKYKSVARWNWRDPPIKRCKAVLVESVRVNGKPRLKHIAFIHSYGEGTLDKISARTWFWRHARKRLDRLANRITPGPHQDRGRACTAGAADDSRARRSV